LRLPALLAAAIATLAPLAVEAATSGVLGAPAAFMALPQGTAPWATRENDAGEVTAGLRLTNLTLVLRRTPARQEAFEEFLRQQQDPESPQFHHWLTADQLGEGFGAGAETIEAVSSWLRGQGLQVGRVSRSGMRIEFEGTAASVGAAFGTQLHYYLVDGERRISAATAPRIPAFLSNAIVAVGGLETIHERPLHQQGPGGTGSERTGQPDLTSCSGSTCNHYITPADFATIYDLNPVYGQGITGAGQTIAIIGRANVNLLDVENYQARLGMAVKDPVTVIPPNGVDPGPPVTSPPSDTTTTVVKDQGEATLDVTRASGTAPGATILLVISASSATTSGLTIASEYVVDSTPAAAQVMSISFSSCDLNATSAYVSLWDSIFSQAAAEGVTVIVSSGDAGAATCDKAFTVPPASQAASPNAICASSYATCVGGTEFADAGNPGLYWSSSNGTGRVSALGYIPEGAWNEPVNGSGAFQVAATGGGVSSHIATPSWQAGLGLQGRGTPDVAFSAAGHDSYFMCSSIGTGNCVLDSSSTFHFSGFSGTSAAAPSMAGIAALLNQKMGSAQGNLNPRLYALAQSPSNGVFHDVTVATSGVASCDVTVPSMCNNSTPGASALTGGLPGYLVGPGYDLATGLGSIDVANLLARWASAATPGQLQMPSPLAFASQAVGTRSSSQVALVTNIGGSSVTISKVTTSNSAEFPATTTCVTTLSPGSQCNVTVSFSPTAAGARSATFVVTSDGVGSPQSFTASGTGTAASANYQGLWWASPAGSESGWGINFAHQGDTIFATWFTYDLSGTGNWLVMTAPKIAANTYSGTLYSTTGPAFNSVPFNPGAVTATAEGTGTLAFTDGNNGTFSYVIGSTSQAKAITREVFGAIPACNAATNLASATNYTDLWWASPAGVESGWGINLTHEGTTIFGSWFTYDTTGRAMWLVVTAPQTAPGTYSGTLYRTTGPPFNSVPFNPSAIVATPVGSATFTFANGNSATFAYTVNGISQAKAITREIFSGSGTSCQ